MSQIAQAAAAIAAAARKFALPTLMPATQGKVGISTARCRPPLRHAFHAAKVEAVIASRSGRGRTGGPGIVFSPFSGGNA